jgi:molybdenum cofactor biosynthesis protein MoaC
MIDVSEKRLTLRYARAEGRIGAAPETVEKVKSGNVPKGNVLEAARTAGILAAKKTADLVIFCHPIPLDWIDLSFSIEAEHIIVTAEVKAIWRTGVEMEAITAVMVALLNIYDMLKPLDDELVMSDIRVVEKRGGAGDFSGPKSPSLRAAVLVISDSTFAGEREDKSGKAVSEILEHHDISVAVFEILPDDRSVIANRLAELADVERLEFIFTTGGTGFGPRDVTPDATGEIIERGAPGLAEAMRKYGDERTPHAVLSRGLCGIRKGSLIINLPGSETGARESMAALFPGLHHAHAMIRGEGH